MQEAAMSGQETAGKVYGKAVIADSKDERMHLAIGGALR